MPTYEYQCQECSEPFERRLSIADCDLPQTCSCGGSSTRLLSLPNFILQGDSWPGKANKIHNQMREKNRRLDVKARERRLDAPVAHLVPNVDGERTESWADAQRLAASKGKNAASYTPMVRAEKTPPK